ncbi:MAG: DNA methyltransferase, partial [Candidatus Bipolaricaulota bacterium]
MPGDEARVRAFVERWSASGGGERSNYQLFLVELCDVLGLPRPDPARPENERNAYVFERAVSTPVGDGTLTTKFIDLYRRSSFVLEAKQGVERDAEDQAATLGLAPRPSSRRRGVGVRGTEGWDSAMVRARHQAERYARALPADEGRPPFILVVDVGHVIEVYAEFTRTGGTYTPFPDPLSHRLALCDLEDEAVRDLLRRIWNDPLSLDPSRRAARVTREVAERLARLARSFEASGHPPEQVAPFLMRCIFTMFAEDIGLIPAGALRGLLEELRDRPGAFVPVIEELWQAMKTGSFSTALRLKVRHFNGHLFEDTSALPVTQGQLDLLVEAARADWRDVEPAIFGTLLERALDPAERHKLGAHFTPRAYVERLVLPTVIEPLREEWTAVQAAATQHLRAGAPDRARAELDAFHYKLCQVKVLDPACGSGNFLYVTLEHMKRLEGEVLDALERLGEQRVHLETLGITVDPHQFYGIEVNPHAVAIADLVLWIGYLQWHVRTRGDVAPPEPVIRNVRNVFLRDAVLQWDRTEPVLDADGNPVTRWNGKTTRIHPTTEEPVPNETARVPVVRYVNPRPAHWPPADFVVGNPPYIGNWRMRTELGDGYAEAIRHAHPELPETCDYVMYWWDHAAKLVREGKPKRFGFITTNSLRQTFSRRVVERHLRAEDRISILFAIPDHPWVDAADG